MDFYAKTNDTIRSVHEKFSHDFTVVQYTWDDDGSTNAYADGDWDESDRFTVPGTIRDATLDDVRNGPEGQEVSADVVIYVPADQVAVSIGTGDESRATEFIDSRNNKVYEAVNVKDEGSLLRVLAYEVNDDGN